MRRIGMVFFVVLMALSAVGCGEKASNEAADMSLITVEAWGPKSTALDQKDKRQKDGAQGIWFKLSKPVQSGDLEAWAAGRKLNRVRVDGQKGAFVLEPDLLTRPMKFSMHLVHISSGQSIPLGDFEVAPSADVAPEIAITAWGPKATLAGKGFNVQKNGASSIWFKMSGTVASGTMEAWLGNRKLEKLSIVSDKGGAMQIRQELITKEGEYPVYFVHKPSNKRYPLGTFVVK